VEIAAAILAGGRATRMGGAPKPLLEVAGARVIDRQLAALRRIVGEVLIVTNDPAIFDGVGARIVLDRRPGLGPLAGLEAAILASGAQALVVVGGDMPALAPGALELVRDFAPEADAAVPFVAGRPEPLHARYHRRVLPKVQARLDASRLPLTALLDDLAVARIDEEALRAVDPTLLTLANVNTPDDLERLEALLRAPTPPPAVRSRP
jgi:molybdenum cofactor guanylyltransferase